MNFPYPLHPLFVHFPIALYCSAWLLEIASLALHKEVLKEILHRSALTIYILACLLTPLTVLTGLGEQEQLKIHHPVMELHERLGLATLIIGLSSLIVMGLIAKKNRSILRKMFLTFLFIQVTLVAFTGHHGGRLVYEYGIGIEEQLDSE